MNCLVLGGRGFIGSHLIGSLLAKGFYVRCFDRPHVAPLSESHLTNPFFEMYEGDLVSEADVAESLDGCDICFHLVSTTLPKSSNADPVFDIESNVLGTVRLLTRAVKSGVKKVIFVSSGGTVYGVPNQIPILETHTTDPICSYGITKLMIEKYLSLFKQLHGLDYTVFRLANPFGVYQRPHASQGAVAVFLDKVLRGQEIEIWGDGGVTRDYIYISDVAEALVSAISYNGATPIFNIGSGVGTTLNELITIMERVLGRTVARHYRPGRLFDVPVNVLDNSLARQELGWEPRVKLEEGIAKTTEWMRAVLDK